MIISLDYTTSSTHYESLSNFINSIRLLCFGMVKRVPLLVEKFTVVTKKTDDREFEPKMNNNHTGNKEEEFNNTLKNYMLDKVNSNSVKQMIVLRFTHKTRKKKSLYTLQTGI